MIWGDIQSGFSALLNRRDTTAAQQASFLQSGIQKIQRELRCPAMEKGLVVTIPSDYSGGLPIPTDFIELQELINSRGSRITKEDVSRVLHLAGGNNTNDPANIDFPRYYVRLGAQWVLAPTPAIGDTVMVIYYADIPSLVNPGDQCTLTQIAGDLFIYAGLTYAGDFYTDKRSDKWEARYEQIKADLQGMADADELTGGSEVSPAISYPDDHQDDF